MQIATSKGTSSGPGASGAAIDGVNKVSLLTWWALSLEILKFWIKMTPTVHETLEGIA